ncbi:MAG: hypothetical protein JSW60_08950, partial [Thermoplasmatales archaeon]
SIIAVAILIGVSFTSVVGYSGVKSNVKASPLFTVRTKRAIEEESKIVTSDYVGKGEESILSIPKRDNRIEMALKIADIISKMDDKAFDEFIDLIICYIDKIDRHEIFNVLQQLRDNPAKVKNNIPYDKDNRLATEWCFETVGGIIVPRCLWQYIFLFTCLLVVIILIPIDLILILLTLYPRLCK